MNKFLLLFLSVGLTASGATIPGGREAWCNLLRLPTLHYGLHVGWESLDGLTSSTDKPDPTIEIPKLKARLQGGPADAAVYWDMWRVYVRAEEATQASNTLTRVVALYRQRAETESENPAVLAQFGHALLADGKIDEAGAVLRKAVRVAPKDWRVWSALANWHLNQAWEAIHGTVIQKSSTTYPSLLRKAARKQIPASAVEVADKARTEAERCADRTVELATNEPMAYISRASTRSTAGAIDYVIRVSKGAEPDTKGTLRAWSPTNLVTDFRQVAQLSPRDPLPLAAQLWVVTLSGLTEGTSDDIDESTRRAVHDVAQKLEEISHAIPPRSAAFALEARGNCLFVLEDGRGAEESLRRAVELDPARESAWDFLITTQGKSGRLREAQATAERRIKQKETVRGRLYAAKVCDKLGLAEQAMAHANGALALEPRGYLANMTAGVLILKHSKSAESAEKAKPFLFQAKKQEGYTVPEEDAQEFNVTVGIYHVLTDDLDEAREAFRGILSMDKDNETAKQALAMLAGK